MCGKKSTKYKKRGQFGLGFDSIAEAKGRRIEIPEFLRPLKISSVSLFMCALAIAYTTSILSILSITRGQNEKGLVR